MTVHVDLVSEDLGTGVCKLCAHGQLVLVAIDDSGNPVEVPPLEQNAA